MPGTWQRKRRPAVAGIALIVVLAASAVEVAAWFVEGFLASRTIVYRPPAADSYEEDRARRDPLLGWPSRDGPGGRDSSGSRPVPAFPDPGSPSCVSLYGDSFTWGDEVADEDAWGNQLARRLRCRVSNFGVGGYGTDQAYLRFQANTSDHAPVVVLGYLSENILRNVNRFRPLLAPVGAGSGLKPRFVLGADGALELVPMPDLSAAAFRALADRPDRYLDHEDLLPGSAMGPTWDGFPHTLRVLSALGNFRIRQRLKGRGYWEDFYREDHPAHARQITIGIMRAFVDSAHRRQRTPVVVFFPTYFDMGTHQRGRPWCYGSLRDELRSEGVSVVDAGDALIRHLGGRAPDALFVASAHHLNEEGNRIVADEVGRVVLETQERTATAP